MARIALSTAIFILPFAAAVAANAAQPTEAPATAAPPGAAAAAPQATADAEAQVDDGLKRFGYLAGLARGCVIEAQQVAFDREALGLHASIARLLGTDRAFVFATAFGYGTSVKTDSKDCADVLKAYEGRVAKYRAGGGKVQ
jgi:hypothetical protein